MDSIPIKYLGKIHSISAVKVLISFLLKAREANSLTVEYSILDIAKAAECSRNTAKAAIAELIEIGVIIPVEITVGNKPNKYRISFEEKGEDGMEGWNRASAAEREQEQKNEIMRQVRAIDFDNMNFVTEDINSGMINMNVFMTEDEIRKLSHRVVMEYFYRRVSSPKKKEDMGKWIAMQKRICTDLLVKYSTEQVCAGITFWVELKGLTRMSLMFLHNDKKMAQALDYYKNLYLETKSHDDARKQVEESAKIRLDEKQRAEQEKEKVDSMSNEDFLSGFIGSLMKKDDS